VIIDGHCHVWENWPYQPPVPDPGSRARAEQLLFEMDAANVERAVIICAAIGDNPCNADHAFEAAARHAGRLVVFPDLECRWSPDYRKPGAPRRFEQALARWTFSGFTMYLEEAEDGGWLTGEEGAAVFALAARHKLIASLSVMPHQMPAVAQLAAAHPSVPILCHHHAFLGPRTQATPNALGMVVGAAAQPSIFIKVSGMGNVAGPDDEYPYARLSWIPRSLRDAFGPDRLIWGSDYPVSRRHMTYKQALAMTTRHGPFSATEQAVVLGGTIARLLAGRPT
jgi:predicted TIM-barrel fold metal-dependent hydrolase